MAEELQRFRVQQRNDVIRLVTKAQEEGNLVNWAQVSRYVQLNQTTCKLLAEQAGLIEAAGAPPPPPDPTPPAEEPATSAPRRRVKLRRDDES